VKRVYNTKIKHCAWNVVLKKDGEISWAHRLKNEVLHRVKEERSILRTVKKKKANWIGHILHKNVPLRNIIEGK
jgi:hypothetical protein